MLLDTQSLLWLVLDNSRLGPTAKAAAKQARDEGKLKVSAVSFWEIALEAAHHRLGLPLTIDQWRTDSLNQGIQEVPITGEIGVRSVFLTDFHKDPADRIIMATAILNGETLLTSDRRILAWPGPLHRQDARR